MFLKRILVLASFVSLLGVMSCNEGKDPTASVKISTEEDKTLYSMGLMLGQNLARLELNDRELNALAKGLYVAAKGQKAEIEWMEYQPKIQEFFQGRMKIVTEKSKVAGKTFLEKFSKEEGVKTTASGIAYKVIKEGTGNIPKATDTVEVHYHGTLIDGTVFDSSVERKQTVSFPLDRVIKGWTEGLQLMKEGGKTKFVIPSELAYGEMGAAPKIPGGATLTFEVELIKIKSPEELKKEETKDAVKVASAKTAGKPEIKKAIEAKKAEVKAETKKEEPKK
ncbi:MAG: FKBP-type peptidyl-prolyl cis-trans isomerase [Bacteriovoracaceae bacterium]|nr:FKBP-type peptidyl-prolyl cis-trans isomerase [Bacteriovoracaceae bacterium]